MRGRYSSADAAEAASYQIPIIASKESRPMDKGRNGARYFRNPPQPHMCIQDFIEDTNEPCFINVLSWVKISTPRRPEDPIPLYGGMQVPHSSSTALSLSAHFGSKGQPIIFAVMANPEILRLSGKTAQDPSDRDALVELMIDFVEAMNPDMRFKRAFTVLQDRDLAGELKDIWLAVQAKRERERDENNGRRAESDGDRYRPRYKPPMQAPNTSPSTQTSNEPSGAPKCEEKSTYSMVRSYFEQMHSSETKFAEMMADLQTGIDITAKGLANELAKEPIIGATEVDISHESLQSSPSHYGSYRQQESEVNPGNVVCTSSADQPEDCRHQPAFTNSKVPLSSVGSRSHEDLLPTSGDTASLKFVVGHDHNTVAIP